MSIIYPALKYSEIQNIQCMARQKKDYKLQCNRLSKYNGLCGYCKKRMEKSGTVILVSEPYIKKVRIKHLKKKVLKRPTTTFIDIYMITHLPYNKLSMASLRYTLQQFHLKYRSTDRKRSLYEILQNHYKPLIPYIDKLDTIKRFQTIYKNRYRQKMTSLRGPALFNRHLCVNDTDFYTFEPLSEINNMHFFSYVWDEIIYGFDIRSFHKLLGMSHQNPYDKKKIPTIVIRQFQTLYTIVSSKLDVIYNAIQLTKKQLFVQEVLNVFQKMDALDNYTDIEWFTSLNIGKLQKFYHEAEDIWNYRAQLNDTLKNNIIPGGIAFHKKKKEVYNMSIHSLRKEILREMDRFVSLGKTRADRVLGTIYMLTALVIVSKGAYEAYPHLLQI